MDIHMQHALKKVQDWYAKASDWQKDLFCTVWEGALRDEQMLDRAVKIAGQGPQRCTLKPTPIAATVLPPLLFLLKKMSKIALLVRYI